MGMFCIPPGQARAIGRSRVDALTSTPEPQRAAITVKGKSCASCRGVHRIASLKALVLTMVSDRVIDNEGLCVFVSSAKVLGVSGRGE